ncbi:putative ankyrin repeat protein RF_0381 isoform X1 [Patella vulgata]|uniref:putative ankyrin repeat protein RF_0381 isoform X1 n=1 Tax=Patella vulgata TaxID=6465 RepID=UPI0021808E8A|nr:putative ankyrin repeat protein RF_0381 isoform X1 [Patella vulgata]XP_055955024.1 putative ankyrin repeat protein RF_0381 isoform X1 [Patella vulgata]
MASLKDSKRTTDERINRPGTHSQDFYQLQNIVLLEDDGASSTKIPQRLAPGKTMVHMSTFKDYHDQIGNKNVILEACRHGSVAKVRHLIDQGTDVNSKDVHGRTCILLCSTSPIEPIEKIDFLRSNGGNIQDIDDENNGILHLACDLGTLETVQYLVNIGLDINTKGYKSRSCIMACSQSKIQATDKIELLGQMGGNILDTDVKNDNLLHLACHSGSLDTVRYLINQGLDINTKGRYGRTCILLCSQSETQAIEKIELLISKGGNIYDTDDDNHDMLHLACMLGTLETVRYMIDLGLDVNAKCKNFRTPILHCCTSVIQPIEKIKIVSFKGGNIYEIDGKKYGILLIACASGTLDTVRYLLDLGLDINTKGVKGNRCILLCSESKIQAIEKIEFLRSKGGNVNDRDDDNNGMFHLACACGTLDTVRYLIDLGFYINAKGLKGRTCILQCSTSKIQSIAKIELLRSNGGNINDRDTDNNGMLHLACISGTLDTVKHLMDLGLRINNRGEYGRTCIMTCSLSTTQASEKIEILRLNGGNVNDRDDTNSGILHLACADGTLDTVKHLIDLGLDINTKGRFGSTCILYCVESETQAIEKIELLRSKGGNIHDRDDNNRGILHHACENGTLDIVQYLVNLGLDINSKDGSGNTPVSFSFMSGVQSRQKLFFLMSLDAELSWLEWLKFDFLTLF